MAAQDALDLAQAGKHMQAAWRVRQATDLLPGDADVRVCAALVEQLAGRYSEAARHIQAISGEDMTLAAWLLKGSLALDQGDFDTAERAYNAALQVEGGRAAGAYGRGLVERARNNRSSAMEWFTAAAAGEDPHAPALATLAKEHLALRNFEQAEQCAHRLLHDASMASEAHLIMGLARAEAGDFAEAGRAFDRAEEEEGRTARVLAARGCAEWARGDLSAATVLLRQALDQDRANVMANAAMGAIIVSGSHGARDRLSEACEFFERALELDPQHDEARLGLALVRIGLGQSEVAEPHLRLLSVSHPLRQGVMLLLAECLAAQGRPREAMTAALDAVSENPDDLRALEICTWACFRSGRYVYARPYVERLVALRPEDVSAGASLALVQVIDGEVDDAIRTLRSSRHEHPSNRHVFSCYSLALLWAGSAEEAAVALRDAIKADPSNPEFYNDLGVACLIQGELHSAEQALEQAAKLWPQWSMPYANLAVVKLLTYDFKMAESFNRRALTLDPQNHVAEANIAAIESATWTGVPPSSQDVRQLLLLPISSDDDSLEAG